MGLRILDDRDGKPGLDDDRTAFRPSGSPAQPRQALPRTEMERDSWRVEAKPPAPSSGSSGWHSGATGWNAAPSGSLGAGPVPRSWHHPSSFDTSAPGPPVRGVRPGDILNDIFKVDRFVARGGMGEVFEGHNINSEERVAIKVMLPALAEDSSVQALFRREARTLTRLSHPALVQYRVLAQERQLGILYIVTDFVDGPTLAEMLGSIRPSPDELKALLIRLAQGLSAAHELGAIHRDLSPDNVLLDRGRLEQARIIDFGIAKDLDTAVSTIVGDKFAGKLAYVAPEQLGAYERSVGPWTDVYGLALVALAVAQGKNVEMGGSFAEAIEKRKKVPDLAAIPAGLRPVVAAMLRPNPAERIRSMDELLARLSGSRVNPLRALSARADAKRAPGGAPAKVNPVILAAVGAASLALLGVGYFALRPSQPVVPEEAVSAAPPPVAAPAAAPPSKEVGDPVQAAQAAIAAALPGTPCSWLAPVTIAAGGGGVTMTFGGVAGRPVEAQSRILAAVEKAGVSVTDADFSQVAQIDQPLCDALQAFSGVRDWQAQRLTMPPYQSWEITEQAEEDPDEGTHYAKPLIHLNIGNPAADFALFGLEPDGAVKRIADRADLQALATDNPFVVRDSDDRWKLTVKTGHTRWSGIMLVTGNPPFDASLIAAPLGSRGPDWVRRFEEVAKARRWKTEMIWYKAVDEIPDTPSAP